MALLRRIEHPTPGNIEVRFDTFAVSKTVEIFSMIFVYLITLVLVLEVMDLKSFT